MEPIRRSSTRRCWDVSFTTRPSGSFPITPANRSSMSARSTPAAAGVDLSLIELLFAGVIGKLPLGLVVNETSQHLLVGDRRMRSIAATGPFAAQRRGVNAIVAAGVCLRDVLVETELRRRVEDGFERLGFHIVAIKARALVGEIQLRRLCRAEIPDRKSTRLNSSH